MKNDFAAKLFNFNSNGKNGIKYFYDKSCINRTKDIGKDIIKKDCIYINQY